MSSITSLQKSAVLQAVPPAESNIAMPHEEEEEWIAVLEVREVENDVLRLVCAQAVKCEADA